VQLRVGADVTWKSGVYSRRFAKLSLVFILWFTHPALADDAQLMRLFEDAGIEGTMIISSQRTNQTFIHNSERAGERFTVASTFKIPNTLIALEEGVIGSANDVIEWDGRVYDIPEWNGDQTLDSAFKVSCVWCYQKFARRIGVEKYQRYLRESGYGVLSEPFELTKFWLDGSLLISAAEQIDFLRKVQLRMLPFGSNSFETLKKVMLIEQTPGYSLWAKSGWAVRVNPQVGWYVGIVETADDVWYFASNIKIRSRSDLALRELLTRKALMIKGVLNQTGEDE